MGGYKLDIQRLEIFLKTIDIGSITKAADLMGYSQSAVSHSIATLEKELNVRLLFRDRVGVRLTAEGSELLPYIQNMTNSHLELQNKIANLRNLDYGTIRLGTYTSTAVHWLPGILNSFRSEHPSVEFEVKYGNYAEIVDWIQKGMIDCGFTVVPRYEGVDYVVLKEDRLFVIFPPGHPLNELDQIEPEDIAEYPYVFVIEGDDPIIYNFFKDRNITLNIQYRVVDDYAAVAMVEGGLGISVIPELLFYRLPFRVLHRPIHTSYRRKICLSYKANYMLSPIVESFIKHVQKWVKTESSAEYINNSAVWT